MISTIKSHPLLQIVRGSFIDLPSPAALSLWWNLGSLLGLCLGVQLLSGLFLAMHYLRDTNTAFERVRHISRDVNLGWLLRMVHTNGASLFFICLYLHAGRGVYYQRFYFKSTWLIGVALLLAVIAAAFMGYVLPWGQISFWGATVITNLFSAIPLIGADVVTWIWGGFAVDRATLTRFFAFHFLIPFVVSALALLHLLFLHQTGSRNPAGVPLSLDKLPFHPYFSYKDFLGFAVTVGLFGILVLLTPWSLGDPENFIPANPLVTPLHIQPEWYFLFAYAILRSIPNKLGGVIALAGSVLILAFLPFGPNPAIQGANFYVRRKVSFWALGSLIFLLTWIGARPVEAPYILSGQILTLLYFSYFAASAWLNKLWDSFLT